MRSGYRHGHWFLLAILGLSTAAHAELKLYAAKTIMGLDQGCQQPDKVLTVTTPAIACDFVQAVSNPALIQQATDIFQRQLQQDFAGMLVTQIDNDNKSRTFIASLEVIRAKRYGVNKGSTAELFLPVTMSLKLTNMLTGELIYSKSATYNQPLKVLTSDLISAESQQQIDKSYQTALLTLTGQLSSQLRHDFRFDQITANVTDFWKSYVLLDKGFDQGIGKDDELSANDGSLIRVVHADAGYSVAVPVLMTDNKSRVFSKISTAATQSVKKPKVLIADVLGYQGESTDLVEQVFADAVGQQAAFSLTPVNRRYIDLADIVAQETRLQVHEDLKQRMLPDLFIRLTVLPTTMLTQNSGQMTTTQVVDSYVMGELIDSSGKVIFAAVSNDRIQDTISDGMGFSPEARREIATKNALLTLADQFKKRIHFTRSDLKVVDTSNSRIVIDDPSLRLTEGMAIKVYTSHKSAGQSMLVPIWDAFVSGRQGTQAFADLAFPVSGDKNGNVAVSRGDSILLDTGESVADTARAYSFCTDKPTESVGDISFSYMTALAYNAFANQSKYPFYATGGGLPDQRSLSMAVKELTENAGFRSQWQPRFVQPGHGCMQPAYRIKNISVQQCAANNGSCEQTLSAGIAVRVYDLAGQRVDTQGLEQKITLNKVDAASQSALFDLELLKHVPALLGKLVQQIDSSSLKK